MTKINSDSTSVLSAAATNSAKKTEKSNGSGKTKGPVTPVQPVEPAAVVTLSPAALNAVAAHNKTKALAAERDAIRQAEAAAKANAPRPEPKIHVRDLTAAVNSLKDVDGRLQADFREARDTYKASETGKAFRDSGEREDDPFRQDAAKGDPFAPKDETDPFKAVDVAWRDPGVTSYQSAMTADEPLSRFTTFA